MKHKLTIGVSNKSPKSRVVTYKKVSPEAKVKDVIGDVNKVAIIIPGTPLKVSKSKKPRRLAMENKELAKENRVLVRNDEIEDLS